MRRRGESYTLELARRDGDVVCHGAIDELLKQPEDSRVRTVQTLFHIALSTQDRALVRGLLTAALEHAVVRALFPPEQLGPLLSQLERDSECRQDLLALSGQVKSGQGLLWDDARGRLGQAHVERALNIVRECYANPEMSLGWVAERTGVSRWHLGRSIVRLTRRRFLWHLHTVRIRMAKALLVQSHMSVKAVAVSVGYRQSSELDRVFKKWERLTPGEYRKIQGEYSRGNHESYSRSGTDVTEDTET